jgi:hypothetical protein
MAAGREFVDKTGRQRILAGRHSRACLSTCGGAHGGVTGGREIRSTPSRAAAGRTCTSARKGYPVLPCLGLGTI